MDDYGDYGNERRLSKPPIGGAFQFEGGFGIVINDKEALLFNMRSGKKVGDDEPRRVRGKLLQISDYTRGIGPVPERVSIIDEDIIPHDVNYAIQAVRDVLNHLNGVEKELQRKKKSKYK